MGRCFSMQVQRRGLRVYRVELRRAIQIPEYRQEALVCMPVSTHSKIWRSENGTFRLPILPVTECSKLHSKTKS